MALGLSSPAETVEPVLKVNFKIPPESLKPLNLITTGAAGYLKVWEGEVTVSSIMTTLMGVVEGNDAILCTDGFARSDDSSAIFSDCTKSMRISSSCALAFAGHSHWIGKVLARISGQTDWEQINLAQLLKLLEERPESPDQLLPDEYFCVTK